MTGRKGREKLKYAKATQYSYLQKVLQYIILHFLHDSFPSKHEKAVYEYREVVAGSVHIRVCSRAHQKQGASVSTMASLCSQKN